MILVYGVCVWPGDRVTHDHWWFATKLQRDLSTNQPGPYLQSEGNWMARWHGGTVMFKNKYYWNNMVNCKSAKFTGVTHYDHGYEPPRILWQWSKYKAFIPIMLLLASRTGVKLGAAASRINLPTRPEPVSTVGLFGQWKITPWPLLGT